MFFGEAGVGGSFSVVLKFLSDLRSVLGLRALRRVARRMVRNDVLPLAGQLAYFFVLFLFPFFMLLVALVGAVVEDPEAALSGLIGRVGRLVPEEGLILLTDYVYRTLGGVSPATLFFAALVTFGAGSAAAEAITKAANRSYGVDETRSFLRIRGVSMLLIAGFTALVAALSFVAFSPEVGGYVLRSLGLSGGFLNLWRLLGWVLGFLALTLALAVLYYVAPNAEVPFRWVTPGGFAATLLMIAASELLRFWVANVFRYDQLYGQLGAGIVLLIWLYTAGLVVLAGIEINAAITDLAEERRDEEIVGRP